MAWLCLFGVITIGTLTFKRLTGLYCWSIICATIGAALYNLYRTFELGISRTLQDSIPLTVMITIAGLIYVPGEYAMLYAR